MVGATGEGLPTRGWILAVAPAGKCSSPAHIRVSTICLPAIQNAQDESSSVGSER